MRLLFSLCVPQRCVPLRQIFSTKVCSTTIDFLHKGVFHYDRFSPQRCVPLRQIFSTKVCSTTTDFSPQRCVPLRQIFSTKVCSTTTDFLHKGVPLRQIFTKVCSLPTDFLHKGVFHYDRFSPQSFLISSWQQRTCILLMLKRNHEVIVGFLSLATSAAISGILLLMVASIVF